MLGKLTSLAAVLTLLVWPAAAQENRCDEEVRELFGASGLPKVRESRCRQGEQSVHISFLRLDEALTGSLIMREAVPELQTILGKARLVENDVFATLDTLYRKFAKKQSYYPGATKFTLSVRASSSAKSEASVVDLASDQSMEEPRTLWTISGPFPSFGQHFPISLPENVMETIWRTDRWPANFKQTYVCEDDIIKCTLLWRYVDLKELDAIAKSTERELRALHRRLSPEPFRLQPETPEEWVYGFRGDDRAYLRHFALCKHLGAEGWVPDFLITYTASSQNVNLMCTGEINIVYFLPALTLDVAVLENSSSSPVDIRSLAGLKDASRKLRRADDMQAAAAMSNPGFTIEPGAKAIVPLRIMFERDESWARPDAQENAKAIFDRAMSKKASAFTTRVPDFTGSNPRNYTIRKRREGFRAPETPPPAKFFFGPAISVTGLEFSKSRFGVGEREPSVVLLGERPHQDDQGSDSDDNVADNDADDSFGVDADLRLAVGPSPPGSCPLLYSWHEERGDWLNYGKVIHQAQGRFNEGSETVPVHPAARRFRLSEEEPEVSYIRRVRLLLTLRNGETIALDPAKQPGRQAGAHVVIPAYTSAEFEFETPAELQQADIVRAEVEVVGYYVPYDSLNRQMSLLQPRAFTPAREMFVGR